MDGAGTGQVFIFDRRRLFGESLALLLDAEGIPALHHDADDHDCLLRSETPDLVLLDGDDARDAVIASARQIRAAAPAARLLLLVGEHPAAPALVRDSAARGWISRHATAEDIVGAIRAALHGRATAVEAPSTRTSAAARSRPEDPLLAALTPREREVLQAVAEGLSGPQIAERLAISPNTVRTHGQNLLAKLGVSSRLEAAAIAVEAGLGPRAPLGI